MLCAAISPCSTADVDDLMRPRAIARRVNMRRAGLHRGVGDDAAAIPSRRPPFPDPDRRWPESRPSASRISAAATRSLLLSVLEGDSLVRAPARKRRSNLVPVQRRMPSRRNTFSTTAPRPRRNRATNVRRAGSTVTLTSNRQKNCANSTATGPPPRTISERGSLRSESASSLVRKPISSSPGSRRGRGDRPGANDKIFGSHGFRRSLRARRSRPPYADRETGARAQKLEFSGGNSSRR